MPVKLKRKRDEKAEEKHEEESSTSKKKRETLFGKIKRTFLSKTKSSKPEEKVVEVSSDSAEEVSASKRAKTVTFNVTAEEKKHDGPSRKEEFMTPMNPRHFSHFFTPGTPGVTPGGYTMTPMQDAPPERRKFFYLNEEFMPREGRQLELKTGGGMYPVQVLPQHIRKYGSGFLNSAGGTLYAGILDNGTVKGIVCNTKQQDNICRTVHSELSRFKPKVDRSKYSISFIPVAYSQTSYQRKYGCQTIQYVPNVFVVEIKVECGDLGEIYEDGQHHVYMRRDGGVEGPLPPVEIKEVVITKYLQVLQSRKQQGTSRKTKNMRHNRNISPIKFDL